MAFDSVDERGVAQDEVEGPGLKKRRRIEQGVGGANMEMVGIDAFRSKGGFAPLDGEGIDIDPEELHRRMTAQALESSQEKIAGTAGGVEDGQWMGDRVEQGKCVLEKEIDEGSGGVISPGGLAG